MPTPITQELLRVVTSDALGAPDAALAERVAPIAPDPFVPVASAPTKLRIEIDEAAACEIVAVTDTPPSGAAANARQISAVPLCTLVRTTSCHVRPPPVRLVTVVLAPLE